MIRKNESIYDWEKNLIKSMRDLSDINMQKKAWLGLESNIVSSYDEIISVLYDDFDFERYIGYYDKLNKGNKKLYNLFLDLNSMINSYKKKNTDEEILVDPKWIEITNKAKEILAIWSQTI